jgi:ABC-2 type transport system permease protein
LTVISFAVIFLQRLGINSQHLKALLVVYLKQDFRSGKSFLQTSAKEYATSNLALLSMLGMYVFVGSTTAIFALTKIDLFLYSLVASSVTLFIVALAVIAESGNVIFNETEPDIIGHLPVNSRTVFAAKVMNIFLFTLLLAAAANILPTIAGVFVTGSSPLFLIAHPLSAILSALFATMLVLTSYGLLMRYIDKERFNNFIAYAQTGFSMFLILGYQLMPRLVEKYQLETNPASRKYFLLYPPAWFSGVTLVVMGRVDRLSLALASLALISLAIISFVALRKVAAGYSSFAARLAFDISTRIGKSKTASAALSSKAVRDDLTSRASFVETLKVFFLRSSVERAVFDLVGIYLRRDREIKVRLYPSFSYLIMFPLIGIFTGGLSDPFVGQDFVLNTIIGAAMIPFVASVAAEAIQFSEHYQAAYIFRAAPVANLSDIHRGLRKAAQAYVALPGALILLLLYTVLWQNPFHAFLIIAPWLVLTPALMMFPFIRREFLPLSRKYKKGQQSARSMGIFFLSFFFIVIVSAAQNFSIQGTIPYWLFLTGVLVVSSILYFTIRKISGEVRPLLPAATVND